MGISADGRMTWESNQSGISGSNHKSPGNGYHIRHDIAQAGQQGNTGEHWWLLELKHTHKLDLKIPIHGPGHSRPFSD